MLLAVTNNESMNNIIDVDTLVNHPQFAFKYGRPGVIDQQQSSADLNAENNHGNKLINVNRIFDFNALKCVRQSLCRTRNQYYILY